VTASGRRRYDGGGGGAEQGAEPRWANEAEAATAAKEGRGPRLARDGGRGWTATAAEEGRGWPRRQAGELAGMAAQ
jgi:hypothetical protein